MTQRIVTSCPCLFTDQLSNSRGSCLLDLALLATEKDGTCNTGMDTCQNCLWYLYQAII